MYGWMNEFTVCVDEYISGVGAGGGMDVGGGDIC